MYRRYRKEQYIGYVLRIYFTEITKIFTQSIIYNY